jgi:transaldolase
VLYVESLAAPDTINTVPEKTLLAFAEHGSVKGTMRVDAAEPEAVLAECARAGVDNVTLAARLQSDGTAAFAKSWRDLLSRIAERIELLPEVKQA